MGGKGDPLGTVQETETNKLYVYMNQNASWRMWLKNIWHFEIQTDYLITAKIPNLVIVKKKKKKKTRETERERERERERIWEYSGLCHRLKIKEKRKGRQVLRPCQTNKKAMEQEADGNTNCNWWTWKGNWNS